MVLVLPALFALVFLAMQGAVMYQGRALVQAAAQEGARDAASENGSVGLGVATAESFLANSRAGIRGVTVSGQRGATEASMTVSATTVSLIPGWDPRVTQSASLPVERLT